MSERVTWRHRWLRRVPLVLWLTLVWLLLWGTFDLRTLVYGVLVALLVALVFPVPAIRTELVVRPVALLRLLAYLAADLLVSTVRVSWQALRYGPGTPASIVAVSMRADSDHLIAMVASGVSLAPGKFVLQIDRLNRICYVYGLGVTESTAWTVCRDVLQLERLVVNAVGARDQVERVAARGTEG
ncbi:Na+/H+ antiporter subunit E [Salinifilum aidingensis]